MAEINLKRIERQTYVGNKCYRIGVATDAAQDSSIDFIGNAVNLAGTEEMSGDLRESTRLRNDPHGFERKGGPRN